MVREVSVLQRLVLRACLRGVVTRRFEYLPGWPNRRAAVWRAIERPVTSQLRALLARKLIGLHVCQCQRPRIHAIATAAGIAELERHNMLHL